VILLAAAASLVRWMPPRSFPTMVGDESTITQFARPADVLPAPPAANGQTVVTPQ
jgi:hypothetical protein